MRDRVPKVALRVGINGTGGHGWIGGAYYMQNAARAFALSGHSARWLLERGASSSMAPPDAELIEFEPNSVGRRRLLRVLEGRGAHRHFGLEWAALREQIDVLAPMTMSLGRRCVVPWVGWIPDLQHVDLPHYFSVEERAGRDAEYRAMRDEAPAIVFSSEHAKRRFVVTYGVRERLFVARFPAVPEDGWYRGDPREVLAKFGLDEPFLYLPNQFWVHKNHATVFAAWEQLGAAAPLLVCTGALEDYRAPDHARTLLDRLARGPAASRVRVLGLVERAEQLMLYRCCAAVINPSLYEGWSTTVEEARALGRPVLLSDIPLFREQMGDGAAYFDPHDAAGLVAAINTLVPRWRPGPDAAAERAARDGAQARLRVYSEAWCTALRAAVAAHHISRRGSMVRAVARVWP